MIITILFLACNPIETERIAFDEEFREIDNKLRASEYRDNFVIHTQLAVRLSDLQDLFLRYKPNIVHFSGHGSTSKEIILQNDAGKACIISSEAFKDLFSHFNNHIRCVILNSCYSQAQSEAIAEHIDYVIGMSDTITDKAAISFASAFYQAIGYGRDIKTAFELGCNQIHMDGYDEHKIPVLVSKKNIASSTILEPPEANIELQDIKHKIIDTLPSKERIAVDFVGRTQELTILEHWFNDAESKVWVLAGDGGKGKTAIAYQFGVNKKNDPPKGYEAIHWLSAKKKRFVEGDVVYIDDPDFTDLNSAIDKLLAGYGFDSDISKTLDEKTHIVLELLTKLPALLVVDDIDSLEAQDESAITFFTMDVTKTPSKVLLTSRRALFGFGGVTTQIKGFARKEGIDFVKSRIKLFDLNQRYLDSYMEKIVNVTDGSPLYIEELLRLCRMGVKVKDAISAWEGVDGDIARQYSLKREFDMLSEKAKQVLLCCCLNRSPSTIEEIAVITGIDRNLVLTAVEEIERLFLLPKPSIIKEAPRFDVNINTRSFIINVMKGTELYKKLDVNVRRLSGELRISGKRKFAISEYLKHSSTLIALESFVEAENLLKDAIDKFGEDPDLLAQLGKLYCWWKPIPRLTDARASFKRSSELKCLSEEMYHRWWALECKEQEWTGAIEAAESALRQFPNNWIFKYKAGYAHSRLGSNLRSQFQRDRSKYQLTRARSLLESALQGVNLTDLDHSEREIYSDIYRCLVINSEVLGDINTIRKYLTKWMHDFPDDVQAPKHKSRLEAKFSVNLG